MQILFHINSLLIFD